jgi:alpha-D-ribose 1-methylphosphonate 5-triphosphate synthase subunit PhnG
MPSPRPRKGQPGIKATIDELAVQREQDRLVLEMALSGKNGVEIAAELDIEKSTVTRTLQRVWARTEQPLAHELRAKWDMRIEAALAAIWDKLLAGDVAAVHAFCRLQEQAAKLHGLNQQFANDAGALADALLRDPEALRQRAIELRDELAEARAKRAAEKPAAKPRRRVKRVAGDT